MKDSGYRMALKREADRERSWRKSRQGAFESSMLSLDEHVAKFDDPGKIAAFSDGGMGAESVRNGGAGLPNDVLGEALTRLSERDRAFVRDVLGGKTWRMMKVGKRGFNKRLAKICSLLGSHPLRKSSL